MTLLTPEQVAGRWQVSARTVRRLCDQGRLRAVRVGGQWRVSAEAVERYEIANAAPAAIRTGKAEAPARLTAPVAASGGYLPAIAGAVPWRETADVPASPAGRRGGSATKKKAHLSR